MVNSKVIVKVKGLQIVEETGDSVETVTPGKYYTRNNKHYVTYEDIDDETGVKTKNIIKFNDSFAEVKRSGFMSGKMIFEKGKNNQALHSTSYGDLLMEVLTKDINVVEEKDKINLKIAYELYANNSKISDSEIEIDLSRV